MHHRKATAVEIGPQRVRLGAGGANRASISHPTLGTWSPGDEPGDPGKRKEATMLPVHHVH